MDLPTSISIETLERFYRLLFSLMGHDVIKKLNDFVERESFPFLNLREVVVEISKEELMIESEF